MKNFKLWPEKSSIFYIRNMNINPKYYYIYYKILYFIHNYLTLLKKKKNVLSFLKIKFSEQRLGLIK